MTNGTAVLGLGDIGPLAGKPVMEGKSVLFKMLADVNAFDLEIDARQPADFIKIAEALEPTFGGINLEDIKAPECFLIEDALTPAMLEIMAPEPVIFACANPELEIAYPLARATRPAPMRWPPWLKNP